MFKFLKEMMEAVREGSAEAKAELAEEAAEKAAGEQAARDATVARMATIPAYEKFLVALGAPYKQTYTRELTTATSDGRPAEFLFRFALPPDEKVAEFTSMLGRDFGVNDLATLQTTYGAMLMTEIDPDVPVADKDALALSIARASYLVCTGVAVGFVNPGNAMSMTVPLIQQAMARFDGWADYGQHFVAGEKQAPGSNALGSGFLKRSVDSLLKEAASPWVQLGWPLSPTEQDELLASRPGSQSATEAQPD